MITLHWEEGEDDRGLDIWLRYLDCGNWGLILTATLPRYQFSRIPGTHITAVTVT